MAKSWIMATRRLSIAIHRGHIQDIRDSIHSLKPFHVPQSKMQLLLCEAIKHLELGNVDIVEMLLNRGADINAKVYNRKTPLHFAAQRGKIEMVEMLLDRGANINAKETNGWTSLHHAAWCGKKTGRKIVEMLLDRDADINAKTEHSLTPLDVATQRNNTESIRLLSQHLIKMKIAGFYVNDENLSLIDDNSNFYNVCETEIQAMKNETVGDSYVSFYDILKKSINQLARFLRNESILQVLESGDYRTRFPTYGYMINKQFISGKRRKEFLESGTNVFHSNVRWLPNLCTEKILNYLSDEDIKV